MSNLPQYTGILRTSRMPSSRNGNPRFLVMIDGEGAVGSTRPDASLGYSIQNHEGKLCRVWTHTTKGGRIYVVDVEECGAQASCFAATGKDLPPA